MKKPIHPLQGIVLLILSAVFLLGNPAQAQQSLIQVNGWNAYVHLPADYSTTTKSYPTIIFFPGIGEVGTTASLVITNGPGAYIAQGWNGNVPIGTDSVEFIVVSLQPPAAYPAEMSTLAEIQSLESLYRVDKSNLFLTGLSEGGWCCTTFVTYDPLGGPYTYASQVKAIVNVEGVIPDDNSPFPYRFQNFAKAGGRLCSFEQVNDGRDMPAYTNEMDSTVPNSALLTETDFGGGGHCCWASFYGGEGTAPGIFTLDGTSQTIYQWLAREVLGQATVTIIPPTVNAGSNQTIVTPASSVTLNGSATDVDGTVISYQWTQISGPSTATVASTSSASTVVTGLAVGTYQFALSVTDNLGASGTDTVQVTVSTQSVPPVANAGAGLSITLPMDTATLYGSATYVDGTIESYSWKQISGPSTATMSSATTAVTSLGNLVQGQYSFSLTITDNTGATNTDTTSVTVNAATVCNTNAPKIYTFTTNNTTTDIYQLHLPAKGGDTIKIYSGNYTDVIEFDSLSGDPCHPITIINVGGQVSTATIRIKSGCQYVHLTGTGDPNTTYGFKCLAGPLGMDYGNHIEYDHIEIIDTGGVGMFMKPIPDTTNPYTYYGHGGKNYITTKIHIHNNYIHNTGGEGMYIGPTNPDGGDGQAGSGTWPDGSQILPARLDSIEIDHNILDSIGWTGIQLSNARDGALLHDNVLYNIGDKNESDHQAGIILGGNTNGSIYNNHIQDVTGNGIEAFGYGTINVYNNFVDSAGHDGTTIGQETFYANDMPTASQPDPEQQIIAYNNAFNDPMPKAAFRVGAYYNNSLPSNVYNNTFCIPGAGTGWQSTYLILNVAGSTNTNNILYCGPVVSKPIANAGVDTTITLPASSITLRGSGTETNGLIVSYKWTQASGTSTATIASPTSATTNVTGLVAGVYKFTLLVTDSSGVTATDTVQATVNLALSAPVISSGVTASVTVNTAYSYTIAASNSPTSYGATGLPTGLSINTLAGVISGTPTVIGVYDVTISATNSGGTGKTTLVITIINVIPPAPVVSSGSSISGTIGTSLSYTITASNTPTSYGATGLPAGLSLNTSTGVISGTPTASGTSSVTISAINAGGTGTKALVITVNPPAPVVSSGSSISGTTGTSLSYTITASNTPTSYGATGLPAGLSLNTSTGVISGTPTASGTSSVTISAINAGGTGTKALVITVNPPAPVVSSGSSISGTTGTSLSYTITASNTPTSYGATGLPAGLSLNTSTGVISGTPTTSGTSSVTISAINAGGIGTKVLVITVNPPAPVVSSGSSISGTTGTSLSYTITASNTPTSYGATGLPAGLSLNTSTGVISGTPTTSGTSSVTISAINAGGTGTKVLVITVNPPAPVVSSGSSISGTTGTSLSYTITASNTPTSYGATGLPAGLSLNTSTGVISGTPTTSGTSSVTISAINAGGTGTKALVITVNPPAPVVSSGSSISGTTGTSLSYTITASNTPTSYGATGLPAGLSLNTSTGVISGTPTTSGTSSVTISAINAGGTGTKVLVITVNPPAPVVSSGSSISGTTGTSLSYTITASNTPTSYGATGLPAGLSLNTSTGVISGTPTTSGTSSVTISAINAGGTGTKVLVITVNPPAPVVSSGSSISGTTGTSLSYTITASNTPTSYGATGLPAGLSLNTSTGVISGTPTTSGVSAVMLTAINAGGAGTMALTVTVNKPIPSSPVISSGSTASGTTGKSFSYTITASNTPTSYGAVSLPAGLTINTSTGVISGTPTVSGTSNVTINAINAGGTGTTTLVIIINPPAPVISSGSAASGTTGKPFNYGITASNNPTSYSVTGLPAGLSVNTLTGVISGIPTTSGTSDVTITATNAGGTVASTLVITIGTTPVVNAGTDQQIILPVSSVALNGSATNTTGTITSYQWTKIAGPISGTVTNATAASTTVTNLTAGIYKFVLTVTNNLGDIGQDTMQVTVFTQPIANAGTDQTITLPVSSVTLAGSGTDAGGTIASYQWINISGPASVTIANATSAATSVTGMVQGIYKFTLTVTDNFGRISKDTVQVTVNPASVNETNVPPVAHAGADQTITLPINSVTLTGSGTDVDGTVASYLWTKVSGPISGAITNAAAANTTVIGLIAGVYKFVLIVTDNKGATGKDTMQVTVNAPPVANAGIDQLITLPINSVTLIGSGTDISGTITAYQWAKLSGPTAGAIANATAANTTVTGLAAGIYKFVLTVTDNNGAIGKDTMQVAVNIPPVANAGVDQTITLPSNTVTLNGSGTDADGKVVSYQWAKLSGPTSGTIVSTATAGTTVTGLMAGVYKFVLTVTDNLGATGKDTMQVTVNLPPVANAGADQIITLPVNKITLNGTATDANGTILSYQWAKLSGPSAGTIASAASASTTVSGMVQGIYKFTLTVIDNNGATGVDTMQVIVNVAPLADAGTNQTITLPTDSVDLSGSGVDVDGTVVSYKWSEASGPSAVAIAKATSAATAVTGLAVTGVYKFILTVTDNDGGTGEDSILVTVQKIVVNTPPVANAGTDITIQLPVTDATLNGSGAAATGVIVSYQWAQVPGASTAIITSNTSANTSVTGLTIAGIYKFVLTVTDSKGLTGKDTMQVTVKPANIPPVANAGPDVTIALPVDSVTLNGNGTDVDGTVVAYAWGKISGPVQGDVSDASNPQITLTGLVEGIYKFELTVTDNDGAQSEDTVEVTVTPNLSMDVFAGPNPVQSSLTMQVNNIPSGAKKLAVSLTSTSGATVYSLEVPATQSTQVMQINMSNLSGGLYILNIRTDNGHSVTERVLKN